MMPTSLFVLDPMKPILVYPSIVGNNVASVSYCSAELAPTSKFVLDVTFFIIIAFLLFSFSAHLKYLSQKYHMKIFYIHPSSMDAF